MAMNERIIHGTWFVLRARGTNSKIVAFSAPSVLQLAGVACILAGLVSVALRRAPVPAA